MTKGISPSDSPQVSVVMSVYRPNLEYLRQAVAGILAQELEDLELIVVEDPTEVPVGRILEEFDDPRIIHERITKRVALWESRNLALQRARAELIAVHDGDDVSEPGRLQAQFRFLRDHEEVAVCGTQLRAIDEYGQEMGYRQFPLDHESIIEAMKRFNPLAQPSVMMRRTAVQRVGGYGAGGGRCCEDYDLWARLAVVGARFANLAEPLVRYRIHPGSTKTHKFRVTIADTIRIKKEYFAKDMGWGDRLRLRGESVLRLLPGRVVSGLFNWSKIRNQLTCVRSLVR